jgi:threonine synthase
MKFLSTNKKSAEVGLKEAVMNGLAPDGGLYMPQYIPSIEDSFLHKIGLLTLTEISLGIADAFFGSDIPKKSLESIVERSMVFDAPLVKLSDKLYTLELFHGPTFSFKDFGTSFMAHMIAFFMKHEDKELHILAATSGDTGSAVGQAFLKVPGVKVWILYPKGQVSELQEKQLLSLGHNVTVFEVDGSFDDCQALVKQAFNDLELRSRMRLSSANSINIARLIPQIFYYFFGYGQLHAPEHQAIFSVPSGNGGNLTAGLMAKTMGLPIRHVVAATNINDTVPRFLRTGIFSPQVSKKTISNAMDVGNPSNFARILHLYDKKHIQKDITGYRFTDGETEAAVLEIYRTFSYIADPHGAVGYLGLKEDLERNPHTNGIFLETAHPAKFLDIIEPLLHRQIDIPFELQKILSEQRSAIALPNSYEALRSFLYP